MAAYAQIRNSPEKAEFTMRAPPALVRMA